MGLNRRLHVANRAWHSRRVSFRGTGKGARPLLIYSRPPFSEIVVLRSNPFLAPILKKLLFRPSLERFLNESLSRTYKLYIHNGY